MRYLNFLPITTYFGRYFASTRAVITISKLHFVLEEWVVLFCSAFGEIGGLTATLFEKEEMYEKRN
jgi:hypothetical protein